MSDLSDYVIGVAAFLVSWLVSDKIQDRYDVPFMATYMGCAAAFFAAYALYGAMHIGITRVTHLLVFGALTATISAAYFIKWFRERQGRKHKKATF